MKKPIALCSGINGQDGSYLAEFLLEKGYEVHGIIRRSSSFNTQRIEHIFNQLHLHYGDVTDALSIDQIIHKIKPDEIYHLAAQSHVKVSFDVPGYTAQTDAIGTLNMLEAIRKHCPNTRFYNAATSELFGKVQEVPQKETTPFYPRSPYGVSKIYAFWIVKNYREAYNIFACNGILFNHESERRGSTFVTKKIVEGLTKYLKIGETFYLGNLNAKRDWGYAPDFVKGMWMMLQQETPDDFVLATGETHTIREFIDECLNYLPKDIKDIFQWKKDEEGRDILWDMKEWKEVIGIDEKYYRPSEVEFLLGDSSKAKKILGWEAKTKFKDIVKIMMENELN
ncbi:MAG: GDP-mannose 4,6-dehydratase [Candidatus Nanoarchaeia archaeon]|nr:GDP-mannose 4,6-dehydratase [Candidatus Nanoarchaeia archaeon]